MTKISFRLVYSALPLTVFVASYVLTTVYAATGYLYGATDYFTLRKGAMVQRALAEIGSFDYVALLYLPIVIIPIAAIGTICVLYAPVKRVADRLLPKRLEISRKAIITLAIISVVFCTYKLAKLGALNAGIFAENSFYEKTERRIDLLNNVGGVFLSFAYGINVMLPLLAFISYVMQGRQAVDGIICAVTYMMFVAMVVLTYSKGPLAFYAVLTVSTLILMARPPRPPIMTSFFMVIASVAIFVLINLALIKGEQQVNAALVPPGAVISTAQAPIETAPEPTPIPSQLAEPKPQLTVREIIVLHVNGVLNRMAIAFPYHVAIFKDPAERCGIQGSSLRKLLGLKPPSCILPEKAFRLIFPEVMVQGFQPVPASLSAYAELGWPWSVVVMILSGIVLGACGAISASKAGPVMAAFCIASCMLGYNLSQVPFIASFTYTHGFLIMLVTVCAVGAPSLLRRLNG